VADAAPPVLSLRSHSLPLPAHLDELRKRIIFSVLGALVGFLPCRAFADRIFGLMQQPTPSRHPEPVSFRRANDSPLRPPYRSGLAGQLQAGASSEGRLTWVASCPLSLQETVGVREEFCAIVGRKTTAGVST
jgi:hypothetical protein